MSSSLLPPLPPTHSAEEFFAKNPLPPFPANSSNSTSMTGPLPSMAQTTTNVFQNAFSHWPIASNYPHFNSSSYFLAPYRVVDLRLLLPYHPCVIGAFFPPPPSFYVPVQRAFVPVSSSSTSASNASQLCNQEKDFIRFILTPRCLLCEKLIAGFSKDDVPLFEKGILTHLFKKLVIACCLANQPAFIEDPVLKWIKDPSNLQKIQGIDAHKRQQLRARFRLKLLELGVKGFDELAKMNKISYFYLIETVADALQNTFPLLNNLSQKKKDTLVQYLICIIPPRIRDFFDDPGCALAAPSFHMSSSSSPPFSSKQARSANSSIARSLLHSSLFDPHPFLDSFLKSHLSTPPTAAEQANYPPAPTSSASSAEAHAPPTLPLKRTAANADLPYDLSSRKKAHTDSSSNSSAA